MRYSDLLQSRRKGPPDSTSWGRVKAGQRPENLIVKFVDRLVSQYSPALQVDDRGCAGDLFDVPCPANLWEYALQELLGPIATSRVRLAVAVVPEAQPTMAQAVEVAMTREAGICILNCNVKEIPS